MAEGRWYSAKASQDRPLCLGRTAECDSFSQQDVKATPAREKESHSAYLPSTVRLPQPSHPLTPVRPGELNLMTAGYGINHSEYSTPDTTVLHGIQLWIALPHRDMNTAPAFENFVPEALTVGGQGSGQDAGPGYPRFGGVVLLPGEYEEKLRTSVTPAPDLPNACLKLRGD
ncbi:pirin family protein [Rothia nasimurium]|uniref:pirin family protein n=1 Tax=Rothia nasimurium TaxID=85336 RepID=UPI003AF14468